MNKENEPTFGELPTVDDEHTNTRSSNPQARKIAAAKAVSARTNKPASSNGGIFSLILIFILIAFSAFLFMQLQDVQKQLAASSQLLASQNDSLTDLKERLSVTGTNANMSLDSLRVVVKDQDSEIRKLWDLSNKRNRPEIVANTNEIAALKKSLNTLVAEKNALQKQQSEFETKQAKLNEQLAAEDKVMAARLDKGEVRLQSLDETNIRLTQQGETLQSLYADVASMKKANTASDIADIRLQLADISKRLTRVQSQVNAQAQPAN
ncbi:MAG: hypothetical protein WAO12_07660 [Venatoribacter sp.]